MGDSKAVSGRLYVTKKINHVLLNGQLKHTKYVIICLMWNFLLLFQKAKQWKMCVNIVNTVNVSMWMWGVSKENEEDHLYFLNKNLYFSQKNCHSSDIQCFRSIVRSSLSLWKKILVLTALFLIKLTLRAHFLPWCHDLGRKEIGEMEQKRNKDLFFN